MPGYQGKLDPKQIDEVLDYAIALAKKLRDQP
jgi:hypothetical protein